MSALSSRARTAGVGSTRAGVAGSSRDSREAGRTGSQLGLQVRHGVKGEVSKGKTLGLRNWGREKGSRTQPRLLILGGRSLEGTKKKKKREVRVKEHPGFLTVSL